MKFQANKKILPFGLRHPYLLPVVLIFGFVFTTLSAYVAFSGETVGAKDTRIVQVKIGSETQVVPTRSKYVGELVEALGLSLDQTDKVEPSLDTPIVSDNLIITISRARPILIVDGRSRHAVDSAENDPKVVAEAAGIKLDDRDVVVRRPNDEPLGSGIAAEKFEIFRSIPVTASVYGTFATYHTQAKTIGEFLKENNIALQEGETIQPEGDKTSITPNMLISINAKGKRILAISEPVAFSVNTKNDPKLQAGQSKVESAGVNGEKAVIYELTYDGDRETGRRALQTVVVKPPVNEVRLKGTLAAATYSVNGDRASLMSAAGISSDQHASADFIIGRESGWRPGAISANGCIGLGQRCPNRGTNALASACPNWQTDPVCQLRHFSAYANGRYGSWNGAYSAWQAQHWW